MYIKIKGKSLFVGGSYLFHILLVYILLLGYSFWMVRLNILLFILLVVISLIGLFFIYKQRTQILIERDYIIIKKLFFKTKIKKKGLKLIAKKSRFGRYSLFLKSEGVLVAVLGESNYFGTWYRERYFYSRRNYFSNEEIKKVEDFFHIKANYVE